MDDAHLKEEAAFADAEYSPMLGNTSINETMLKKYTEPTEMWDWRQYAATVLGDIRGKRLLDYGCGQGEESCYFATKGANVFGIDISEVGVRVARERLAANGLKGEFAVMNCLEMTFPDESFDIVHGMGILHHVGLRDGLREIKRVLKPGGLAIFLEPLQSTRGIESAKTYIATKHAERFGLIPVTSGEENLKQSDIEDAAKEWSSHEVKLYHLLHRVRKLTMPRSMWRKVLPLDAWLLDNVPFLRRYAGAAVISLVK
jgi:ubiquinone/menaquinone biosynthesis C-methylase UbiE